MQSPDPPTLATFESTTDSSENILHPPSRLRSWSTFAMTMTRSATTTTTTTRTHSRSICGPNKIQASQSTMVANTTASPSPLSSKTSRSSPPPAYSSATDHLDANLKSGPTLPEIEQRQAQQSQSHGARVSTRQLPRAPQQQQHLREEKREAWSYELAFGIMGSQHHPFLATIVGLLMGISGAVVSVLAMLLVHLIPSLRTKPPPPFIPTNQPTPQPAAPIISMFGRVGKPSSMTPSSLHPNESRRVTFQLDTSHEGASYGESQPLHSPGSGTSLSPTSADSTTLVGSPVVQPALQVTNSFGSVDSASESLDVPVEQYATASPASTLLDLGSPTSSSHSATITKSCKERSLWRGRTATPSPYASDAEKDKPKRQMSIKIPGLSSLKRRSLPPSSAAVVSSPDESPVSLLASPSSAPIVPSSPTPGNKRSKAFSFLYSPHSSESASVHTTTVAPTSPPVRLRTNPYLPPYNAAPPTQRPVRERVPSDLSWNTSSSSRHTARSVSLDIDPSEFGIATERRATRGGGLGVGPSGIGLGRPSTLPPHLEKTSAAAQSKRVVSDSVTLAPSATFTGSPSSPITPKLKGRSKSRGSAAADEAAASHSDTEGIRARTSSFGDRMRKFSRMSSTAHG